MFCFINLFQFKKFLKDLKECFLELKLLGCILSEESWIRNHYRLIMWRLACYECLFPKYFANCLCTYDTIFEELIERYQRELNLSQRSVLKRIIEKDENPGIHMILSVIRKENKLLELTDGWYSINSFLHENLKKNMDLKKIKIGDRFHVCNSFLSNEEYNSFSNQKQHFTLKIMPNNVGYVYKNHKLGKQWNKKAFLISFRSIRLNGGIIPLIRILVKKKLPKKILYYFQGKKYSCNEKADVFILKKIQKLRQAYVFKEQKIIKERLKKEFGIEWKFTEKGRSFYQSANEKLLEEKKIKIKFLFTLVIQEVNLTDEITGENAEISLWTNCILNEGLYYKLYNIKPMMCKNLKKRLLHGTKFTRCIPYFPKCNFDKRQENIRFDKFLCFSDKTLRKKENFDCVGIISLISRKRIKRSFEITLVFLFDCSGGLLCLHILEKESIRFLSPKVGQILVCKYLQYSSFDQKNGIHNSFTTQNSILKIKSSLYHSLLSLTYYIAQNFPEWIYLMNEKVFFSTRNMQLKILHTPLILIRLPSSKPSDEEICELRTLTDMFTIQWNVLWRFIKKCSTIKTSVKTYWKDQSTNPLFKINTLLKTVIYGLIKNRIIICRFSNFNVANIVMHFKLEIQIALDNEKRKYLFRLEKIRKKKKK